MKVIILAAGQGTRLRPLTDGKPKCMVELNGVSIIDRQIATMKECGIKEEDIHIITGYRGDVLKEHFKGCKIHFIENRDFETTNMVCSLMCAASILESENDIIVSYGDIIYDREVLLKSLKAEAELSVIVDDGWYQYWSVRCENPLDDAETLMYNEEGDLTEIGQKTQDINKVQSQYIGLMHYKGKGVKDVFSLAKKAQERSQKGQQLWKTTRNYQKMYMTDLLQGLIEEGYSLKAIHINRGWYEVDNYDDLQIAEKELKEKEI